MARNKKRQQTRRHTEDSQAAEVDQQHPLEMLREDHQALQGLLTQFEKGNGRARQKIADEALTMLDIHTQLEEKVVYPAIREATGDDQGIDEAEEAHHAVSSIMKELRKGKTKDTRYAAKMKILTENIQRHIESEEQETFPEAEKADIDWQEVGQETMALRRRLMRKMGGKNGMSLKKAA